MATKKVRKRAYIPPASEVVNRKERSAATSAPTRAKRGGNLAQQRAASYPEPSIKRTAKRLPIYFVLIFLLQYYLIGAENGDLTTAQRAQTAGITAAFVTIAFAPFMHVMDRWSYNRIQRKARGSASS